MLYFIRHGQTEWNVLGKCQGRVDIPLNEEGIRQAKELSEKVKQLSIDKYFCSPLQRAISTLEICCGRKIAEDEIDERLIERDFGKFEGFTKEEFSFGTFCNFYNTVDYGTGETLREVRDRAMSFVKDVSEKYPNKNILVISHGGFGAVLRSIFEGIPSDGDLFSLAIKNGHIIELDNMALIGK